MAAEIDYYAGSNDGNMSVYSTYKKGQGITGDGRKIGRARFYMGKQNSPSGLVYVEVWSVTGTWPDVYVDALLSTSSGVESSTMPDIGSPEWIEFKFPSPYTLGNGTHYGLLVSFPDGDGTNVVRICYDDTSPAHAGYWLTESGNYNDRDALFYALIGNPGYHMII